MLRRDVPWFFCVEGLYIGTTVRSHSAASDVKLHP